MTPKPRWWIPGLAVCGFIGLTGPGAGPWVEVAGPHAEAEVLALEAIGIEAPPIGPARAEAATVDPVPTAMDPREADLRSDPRVRAFLRAYGELIDSVTYLDDDLVFTLGGLAIHFQDGRMLAEGRLHRRGRCDSIFYRYPLTLPTEPAEPSTEPVRFCTDMQEVLWGRTEDQIRANARSTTFLDRRMFLNDLVVRELAKVEQDILAVARDDEAVASWIAQMDITYSFIDRGIAGTATRSQHAWGLAVDLVPSSYEGRQVYWRWTRAWNRSGWHRTPIEERWSPPAPVVEIFERHGFVWGGKWARFDNIHFEYRPEILEYNRILKAEED